MRCACIFFPSSSISSQECAFEYLKSTSKRASKLDQTGWQQQFLLSWHLEEQTGFLVISRGAMTLFELFLSTDFLLRMRGYMPLSHRNFIEEIQPAPSLRDHVLFSGNGQLLTACNQCVEALAELRSYHITIVTKYLIIAAAKAKGRKPSHLQWPPQTLEGAQVELQFWVSWRVSGMRP